MDWDATTEILETNSFTKEPKEGAKYVFCLSMEGHLCRGRNGTKRPVERGMQASYVTEDGTRYHCHLPRHPEPHDDLVE